MHIFHLLTRYKINHDNHIGNYDNLQYAGCLSLTRFSFSNKVTVDFSQAGGVVNEWVRQQKIVIFNKTDALACSCW